MLHPYTEFDMADPNLFKGDYIYLERMSLFPQYEEILRPFFQSAVWKKIPIVSNFFVPGTYFIVLLFGISVSFYRKNYKQLFVFGFWGEAHHYSLQRPDQKEEINWEPDNVEEVTEFLMESHLKAFPTTPACMNLHYTEYGFADRVLEQNGVWLRRDSFQAHMNTEE